MFVGYGIAGSRAAQRSSTPIAPIEYPEYIRVLKGGAYGNSPIDHLNSLARWRVAYVAPQFRLGLLSERRIRADFTHLNHIAAYGTDITPSGIFLDRWTPVKSQLAEDGDHSSE